MFPLGAAWKFDSVLALETDQIFEEVWGVLEAFTIFPLGAAWKFDSVLALETDLIFEEVWGVKPIEFELPWAIPPYALLIKLLFNPKILFYPAFTMFSPWLMFPTEFSIKLFEKSWD